MSEGGTTGLAATLEAAEEGVSVTLIEKPSMLGGSTLLSGEIDEELINYIAEHSGETFEWLEAQGVEFTENLSSEGIMSWLKKYRRRLWKRSNRHH